jgi:hypothetical protein
MRMRRLLLLSLTIALLLPGCPDTPATDAGPDAGGDAPIAVDAPRDTGSRDAPSDSGPERDGGTLDAGPSDAGTPDTGSPDSGSPDAGSPDAGTPDAGPIGCPPVADRPVVVVSADITTDTLWTCDRIYDIDQLRYVGAPSGSTAVVTLEIEPGTVIRGEPPVYTTPGDPTSALLELPGALIVTRSGRLLAEGTSEDPIVFTSASAEGSRRPGDWGGLVMLGRASTNTVAGELRLEGLPLSAGPRGVYGAPPGSAEDDWDCGSLRYVRVEFAGFLLADGRELNGISVGACGTTTQFSFVQVHMGSDDGVEFFGGSPDVDHLVVTGAQDDSIDWDLGFRGRLQFVAVQQYPLSVTGANPDRGIEANNNTDIDPATLTPISEPRLFNLTFIGTGDGTGGAGIVLRDGTLGYLANAIVTGFGGGAVDVDDAVTITAATSMGGLDRLVFRNSIAEQSVLAPPSGTFWASDTDGLVESTHFTQPALGNRETTAGTPPTVLPAPFDRAAPGWVPAASSAPATGGVTPGEADDATCSPVCAGGEVCRFGACLPAFFDAAATYVGAFAPGGADWTAGWTELRPN